MRKMGKVFAFQLRARWKYRFIQRANVGNSLEVQGVRALRPQCGGSRVQSLALGNKDPANHDSAKTYIFFFFLKGIG